MFEKNLQDLVKGIRAIKGDTGPFIAKAVQEIKDELKSRDVTIKAQALQKLCYVSLVALPFRSEPAGARLPANEPAVRAQHSDRGQGPSIEPLPQHNFPV